MVRWDDTMGAKAALPPPPRPSPPEAGAGFTSGVHQCGEQRIICAL